MRLLIKFVPALFLCGSIVAATGCGGSGNGTTSSNGNTGGNSGTGTTGNSDSTATVSCAPTTIGAGGVLQCTAMFQGTTSTAANWSSSSGTISSSGQFTAPSTPGAVTITATSTTDATKSGQATVTVATAPASRHVVLVMEENQSYSSVIGNTTGWPHLNALSSAGALTTNYFANVHPSIGNYFMLTTGQLLTVDDNSTAVWNVDNLARRMLSANVSFKVYAEGITQGYLGGNTGQYVIRHNPFAMLSDVAGTPATANAVLCPFSQFATDLANNALQAFSFVVPNLIDDAHDGTPQQADTWLQDNIVAPLSGTTPFKSGGDGLLIAAFDESVDTDIAHIGGQVAVVFSGPNVKAGYRQASLTTYQHQSLLRTLMEALQLQNPPGAAATAPSMAEFFVQR